MPKLKNTEIWAELANMEAKEIELEQVYLDPNNPRLEIPGKERIPDERIAEDEIQQKCLQQMRDIGIADLTESIRTSGFWTVDRVVLRPLYIDKYVVVEGNRRITALITLIETHKKGTINLHEDIHKGVIKFQALVYKGKNSEIAWIIQGFRHTPGIKSWGRYPSAKFFAQFEKKTRKNLPEIAPIFGMKRGDVTHLIRSYYAFEQAKKDEDYGDMLNPDKFGHFDEIILKKDEIKKWMGWDDKKRRFIKEDKLKKYLFWATREEGEKAKVDISPITRDILPKLLQPENKKLFEKFDNGELNLRECEAEILKEETKRELIDISESINSLREMRKMIVTLPIPELQLAKSTEEKEQKAELFKILKELVKVLNLQIRNLEK